MSSADHYQSKTSFAQRAWRYAPLLVWMFFISFASTDQFSSRNTSPLVQSVVLWFFPKMSETGLAVINLIVRKVAHFTEYAILAFLAHRALISSSRNWLRENWFNLTLGLIVVYALLDEYHQSFVPSRTASIYDSAVDIVGGLVILLILRQRDLRRFSHAAS